MTSRRTIFLILCAILIASALFCSMRKLKFGESFDDSDAIIIARMCANNKFRNCYNNNNAKWEDIKNNDWKIISTSEDDMVISYNYKNINYKHCAYVEYSKQTSIITAELYVCELENNIDLGDG